MKNLRNNKIYKIIFFVLFSLLVIYSCYKDNSQNNDVIETRNANDPPTYLEPDYEYFGKSLYEYESNQRGFLEPEEFFIPENNQNEYRAKIDSMVKVYENYTYEEILNDCVSKGLISTEFKNYKIDLYEDLFANVPDVISYLENKFSQVDSYNLSPNEKSYFKLELVYLKYNYKYLTEINDISVDSILVPRETPEDCEFNWNDFLKTLSIYTGVGTVVGTAIGTVINAGPGTAIGAAVGTIIGLANGVREVGRQTGLNMTFCEECIPTGLSRTFTGNCDGAALFLPIAGENVYKFQWEVINGVAEHVFTVPGQENEIIQTTSGEVLSIKVISYCHYDEDTDLTLSKVFGLYDLFSEQIQVENGALFIDGMDFIRFLPSPTSSQNSETYPVTVTQTYHLSGLAISYPNIYTIEGVVSSQNATNITLIGDELTVTWKVGAYHWDEFYNGGNYGETEGIVDIKVINDCPTGESRIFTLKTLLTQGHP